MAGHTDPEAAMEAALDAADGRPGCAVCPESADFFLFEADRVAKFVCWEHVSPYAATVEGKESTEGDEDDGEADDEDDGGDGSDGGDGRSGEGGEEVVPGDTRPVALRVDG